MSDFLWSYGLQPARLLCPLDSPGKNTGADFHALLQGIFLTQESNPRLVRLPHWQVGSLPLVPPGKHFTASHTHSCILLHLSPLFFFLYLHLSFQLDSKSFEGKLPFPLNKSIFLPLPSWDLHVAGHDCRPHIAILCWFQINFHWLRNIWQSICFRSIPS